MILFCSVLPNSACIYHSISVCNQLSNQAFSFLFSRLIFSLSAYCFLLPVSYISLIEVARSIGKGLTDNSAWTSRVIFFSRSYVGMMLVDGWLIEILVLKPLAFTIRLMFCDGSILPCFGSKNVGHLEKLKSPFVLLSLLFHFGCFAFYKENSIALP